MLMAIAELSYAGVLITAIVVSPEQGPIRLNESDVDVEAAVANVPAAGPSNAAAVVAK
jgi:hypothetical protein